MSSRWVTFALLLPLCAYAAQQKGTANRIEPPPFALDQGAVNNPAQAPLALKDKGAGVLRAQILLSRARFSCGELDAAFGPNLEKAVAAFQAERKLPVTRVVDEQTWAALNGDAAPALSPYTISAEDVKGPFYDIPKDLMDQAKLPALGYSSPLEAIAERFHASPEVLQALNPGAQFGKAGQKIAVPNAVTLPPGAAAANLIVSKGESSVRAYDGTGKLIGFYVATIGSEHDPLPLGNWTIRGVARNPKFHYNAELFWDADNPDEKAVIQAGPNNPVGLVWIDLSKEHYGIHGTPEPSRVGHALSHGCIRLTNWDALELAALVKPGTPALLKE